MLEPKFKRTKPAMEDLKVGRKGMKASLNDEEGGLNPIGPTSLELRAARHDDSRPGRESRFHRTARNGEASNCEERCGQETVERTTNHEEGRTCRVERASVRSPRRKRKRSSGNARRCRASRR